MNTNEGQDAHYCTGFMLKYQIATLFGELPTLLANYQFVPKQAPKFFRLLLRLSGHKGPLELGPVAYLEGQGDVASRSIRGIIRVTT